ncbi:hypothetical protein [Enhygromyxa salina]|uniref:Uncharacterized protein n=1 Tax=Enhygromyxa salina TaxID=215803 RepID=A0A2S9YW03_9BACT|nr:hypothetical protein [Enhygromyxa salina]PRQ09285.1 hypothetical protein ENSA7_09770 [Enhygromyxa salina]
MNDRVKPAENPGRLPSWAGRLDALRRRTTRLRQRSRWTVEWAIYRWAAEQLASAAIRIDGTEGLSGPAPARWRLLTHIDADSGALGLAVLDGRAPLLATNVVASLLSSGDEAIVAIRDGGVRRWQRTDALAGVELATQTRPLPGGVELSIDIALGRCSRFAPERVSASQPLRLALALALDEQRELSELQPAHTPANSRAPKLSLS